MFGVMRLVASVVTAILLGACSGPEPDMPATTGSAEWSDAPASASTGVENPVVESLVVESSITESSVAEHTAAKHVYWGDSHLHSSYSTDAGLFGNTLDPDQAYRFAKGETVTSSTGLKAKIIRPLDWLVVADHAENLGLAPMASEASPELLADPWGKKFYDFFSAGNIKGAFDHWGSANASGKDPIANPKVMRTIWHRMLGFAKQHNDPGKFTVLLGYEWTSTPSGNNLHRVVVFGDHEDRVGQVLPFSAYDSQDPEKLWDWMTSYEQKTGGQVFAIAHNGNLSNGLMFDDVTVSGEALSADYAQRRSRWEPLYEVTQIKGDGEAHPLLSPDDEYADYETWDSGNFGHRPKTDDMLAKEYAREALKRGLAYEQSLGVNPFKFGLVGASDAHTSLATTREENFFGKATMVEPGKFPERWDYKLTGWGPLPPGEVDSRDEFSIDSAASGLQGVWAPENTREALFAAMKRKETYATTGTRIQVRVFGGFDFSDADLQAEDFAQRGYARGVPMGGELRGGDLEGSDKAPRMMVQAVKDPDGANLDRIQVVKGWVDAAGKTHEQVIDVSCTDGGKGPRAIKAVNGKVRCESPVGSTVDAKTAIYTNTIGATSLQVVWHDPDFDPAQRAFYYVRVLEIPTPRWSTYDAVREKRQLPEGVEVDQQDRAYTSPIWYSPPAQAGGE